MKKAVILLSGGLDSATIIYVAKSKGYKPYCLIFDYGQRHRKEINQAKRIAEHTKSKYYLVKIDLPWGGSSLLDKTKNIPKNRSIDHKDIPSTYVPARNIIFLSFAASYAEALGAEAVFIGANAVDYSGYPDCRPEFFDSYQAALKKGMKQGVEGNSVKIFTPLLNKTKAQIIKMGVK
ncbi:MAG: 7-cyano-7-deazaguanine synthase QueC, partial [Candidatus Omnitrophica bacterium]|nr:7-cyano-7-deazaguanine synthase QueC [Candidatus Omnitrophota bacterium]